MHLSYDGKLLNLDNTTDPIHDINASEAVSHFKIKCYDN